MPPSPMQTPRADVTVEMHSLAPRTRHSSIPTTIYWHTDSLLFTLLGVQRTAGAALATSTHSLVFWLLTCNADHVNSLTFTSTTLATSGKSMIVQATSTGGDLGDNHFDLAFPGGGNGIFDGCTKEWGTNLGGAQYGGISAKADCSALPAALQAGCNFRFDWFEGADNPTVKFEQVTCPAVLTGKTGCARTDDDAPTSPSSYSSMAAPPKSSSAAAVASSAAAAAVPSPESSATAAAPSATVASSASAASSASPATSAGSAQTYAPSPVASEQASLPVVSSPSSAAVVASSYSAGQAYESMPAASGIVSAPLSSGTAPADEDCKVQYTTIYDL